MTEEAEKYQLLVTAGSSYSSTTHSLVRVNTPEPVRISTPHIEASISVRIKDYRGLPRASPSSSSYFTSIKHASDLYSISFSFKLPQSLSGDDLVFGNDFENPIRDRLPTGFGTALRLVKWSIDPGIDGDVYADKPYLYGPLLSSINVLRIGSSSSSREGVAGKSAEQSPAVGDQEKDGVIEEGDSDRRDTDVPTNSAARMKYFLTKEKRKDFTFEAGRTYECDFFNPYLDFNQFALRLPGITLHLMRFWDGQPLRYVLRQRGEEGERELFVVVFTLVPAEEVEEVEKKWTCTTVKDEKDEKEPPQGDDNQDNQKGAFVDEGVD